ncbi:MAG: hypothetical protein R3C01_17055 [Planctomycetaceae bacterium]
MYAFEILESRRLLAGNVKAAVKGETLILTGDNAGNQIDIDGVNGNITVTGIGTVINGSNTELSFSGIENVVVNLKKGDDVVNLGRLGDLVILHNLSINTAGGDDIVDFWGLIGALEVGGNIQIKTGGGADEVYLDGITVQDSVSVDLGGGSDLVNVSQCTFLDSAFINGRGGFDQVFDAGGNNSFPLLKSIESVLVD